MSIIHDLRFNLKKRYIKLDKIIFYIKIKLLLFNLLINNERIKS